MNYKAFLSAIVVLALVGTVLVLLQERTELQTHVANLVQQQKDTLPPPVNIATPTELVVSDAESLYPREKIMRESERCDYGNCLFTGGGGLVGLTSVDAFYTTTVRKDMDNNDIMCHALYIKRGPAELVVDPKFSKFYGEKKDVLVIPFEEEDVADLADLEQIQASTPGTPLMASLFIPDSAEMGVGPCYGGIRVLDVRAL